MCLSLSVSRGSRLQATLFFGQLVCPEGCKILQCCFEQLWQQSSVWRSTQEQIGFVSCCWPTGTRRAQTSTTAHVFWLCWTDMSENVLVSSLANASPLHQIWYKSWQVLCHPANKQTHTNQEVKCSGGNEDEIALLLEFLGANISYLVEVLLSVWVLRAVVLTPSMQSIFNHGRGNQLHIEMIFSLSPAKQTSPTRRECNSLKTPCAAFVCYDKNVKKVLWIPSHCSPRDMFYLTPLRSAGIWQAEEWAQLGEEMRRRGPWYLERKKMKHRTKVKRT